MPLFSRLLKRVPFDWRNPIGYFFAVASECIIVGYEFITIACTLSFAIGVFWLTVSTIREIQHILHSINAKAQAKKNQRMKLKVLFSELIDTHVGIKQLSIFVRHSNFSFLILLKLSS